jgi:SAM-dependent methyltransferase
MRARDSWDRWYEKEGRPWKGSSDEELDMRGPVLELGIGNGKNLSAFPAGTEIIGLDFSRHALRTCSGMPKVQLVQADVTALPFADGSFPNVAASHVLGHLDQGSLSKACAEIERVLRKDGTLYVSVFGEEDMRCGKGEEVEMRTFRRGNGVICHYFLENEVPLLFPGLRLLKAWERRLEKRYHGNAEVRQERRFLLVR